MFEIGNSLREARLRQRLDFTEAELSTKIRGKYLRALEEERFDVLPAQTYVKGFLRTYAEFLGLDGQLYVDEFNSRFVAGDEEAHPLKPRRSDVRPHRRQRRVESNVVLVALASIAVVTVIVIVAWNSGSSTNERLPSLNTVPARHTVAKPKQPVARSAHLVVTAVGGRTELTVYAGSQIGRPKFSGTLEAGKTQTFTAKRLWIQISTPENVRARLNGRLVRLGAPGAPRIVVATARGIRPA